MANLTTKTCSKCKQEKSIACFGKDSYAKGGIHPQCKGCVKIKNDRYSEKNRGYLCPSCNKALGFFRVDTFGILNLQQAIKYLSGV